MSNEPSEWQLRVMDSALQSDLDRENDERETTLPDDLYLLARAVGFHLQRHQTLTVGAVRNLRHSIECKEEEFDEEEDPDGLDLEDELPAGWRQWGDITPENVGAGRDGWYVMDHQETGRSSVTHLGSHTPFSLAAPTPLKLAAAFAGLREGLSLIYSEVPQAAEIWAVLRWCTVMKRRAARGAL